MSRTRVAASLVAAALVLASCSGTDGEERGADQDTTTSAAPSTTVAAAPPEEFTGSPDDFYVVPDPLPAGGPGDLIRTQDLGEADGYATVRVMYRSVDGAGEDRAVTGLISYPTGAAPDGGWPVLTWAHGTTGLAPQCAPSRFTDAAPGFGIDGVHVATDYIGLGPVGERHAYLSRESEGHSVVDAVRAARHLAEAEASNRYVVVGHSQGGHAALAANELGAAYAPDLELLGTIAYAPAALFDRTYGGIDDVVSRIVGIMGLYGVATEQPDLDPADYVADATAAVEPVLDDACLDEITSTYLEVGTGSLYEVDPMVTEPAASIMEANDVGSTAVASPVLLISGTEDQRVVIARARDLFDEMCAAGQVTEFQVVDGATHDDVIAATADEATTWLEARLAGDPPTDSCS